MRALERCEARHDRGVLRREVGDERVKRLVLHGLRRRRGDLRHQRGSRGRAVGLEARAGVGAAVLRDRQRRAVPLDLRNRASSEVADGFGIRDLPETLPSIRTGGHCRPNLATGRRCTVAISSSSTQSDTASNGQEVNRP